MSNVRSASGRIIFVWSLMPASWAFGKSISKSGHAVADDRATRLLNVRHAGGPMTVRDLFGAVAAEQWSQIEAVLHRAVAEKRRFEREVPIQASHGLVVVAIRAGVTFDDQGHPSRMIGTVVDRTELQHDGVDVFVRARALDSAQDGIIITTAEGPDYPIVYANPGFERLTGYPAQEVFGESCRLLQGPQTDRKSIEEIRDGLLAGTGGHFTLLNYRKDGSTFWNSIRITPLKDPSGITTHFVGVQTDITDRYRAEQSLKQSEAMLLSPPAKRKANSWPT